MRTKLRKSIIAACILAVVISMIFYQQLLLPMSQFESLASGNTSIHVKYVDVQYESNSSWRISDKASMDHLNEAIRKSVILGPFNSPNTHSAYESRMHFGCCLSANVSLSVLKEKRNALILRLCDSHPDSNQYYIELGEDIPMELQKLITAIGE